MEPWKRGKNTHIIHSPGCTFPTKVIRLSELGDRWSCHVTDTHIRCIRPTLNKVFDWNQTNLVQKTGVNGWHWYKTHTILLYFVPLVFSQNWFEMSYGIRQDTEYPGGEHCLPQWFVYRPWVIDNEFHRQQAILENLKTTSSCKPFWYNILTSVGESTIANPPPNVVSRVPFTNGVPSTTAEMFITTSLYLLSRDFCICIPSFWTHERTFSGLFGKKTQ